MLTSWIICFLQRGVGRRLGGSIGARKFNGGGGFLRPSPLTSPMLLLLCLPLLATLLMLPHSTLPTASLPPHLPMMMLCFYKLKPILLLMLELEPAVHAALAVMLLYCVFYSAYFAEARDVADAL